MTTINRLSSGAICPDRSQLDEWRRTHTTKRKLDELESRVECIDEKLDLILQLLEGNQ